MSTGGLASNDWLPGPDAARVLGLSSTRAVRRLAQRGLVGVVTVPGTHPRYRRSDLVKLARLSVRPVCERKGA